MYDQNSKQLSTTRLGSLDSDECPLCRRPFHETAEESSEEQTNDEAGFVSPHYFRRLAASRQHSHQETRSPSPTRRLVGTSPVDSDSPRVAQQASSASSPAFPNTSATSDRISSSAFSQGYFKRFFREETVLGRGGKGVVLLVGHYLDNVFLGKFACKRVPVGDNHPWLERVLMEVSLLQDLSHQNLVSYRHVWLENFQTGAFGPSTPHVFILQQYCVGVHRKGVEIMCASLC